MSDHWEQYFKGIAEAVAKGSKDPSTQVGAVIVRPDRSIVSTGFNGLPRALPDSVENLHIRERKMNRMIHAECNAIDHAYEKLTGYSIYVTAHPCSKCALRIISKQIQFVHYIPGLEDEPRWKDDMALARELFTESRGTYLLPLA